MWSASRSEGTKLAAPSSSSSRRLATVHAALASAQSRKRRVVIVGMTQEVAHQNPVPSTIDDFGITRGDALLSTVSGALRCPVAWVKTR